LKAADINGWFQMGRVTIQVYVMNNLNPIVIEIAKYAQTGNVLVNVADFYRKKGEWWAAIKYMQMAISKGQLYHPRKAQAQLQELYSAIGCSVPVKYCKAN
jgi:hypothetical protein